MTHLGHCNAQQLDFDFSCSLEPFYVHFLLNVNDLNSILANRIHGETQHTIIIYDYSIIYVN